jgi:hypothetical protein
MSPTELEAFIQQCKKLERASSQQQPHDTRSAKSMTEQEQEEWWREHKRRFKQ